ncbi:MAG TPA: glycerol-3-phosphate dehydrogenase [Acetobacteraceae bacterium]|nr:glycerol-3-phosphate dehydrogenase [Acetobacteraceae bacterium]
MNSARTELFDLAIIGGGVNGCGIARDAAGRGLSVLLVEQGDLASGTSSASTKLIHGGLRYLEHHAFRLVRESLAEREVLLRAAPHIIRPMRFVLPHHAALRPRWLIRLGLFLYDHLGGRKILPGTRSLDLRHDPAGEPLRPEFTRGFEYSDCSVDDSRLVVLNARDAATHGADIRTHTRCIAARRTDGVWRLALQGDAAAHARVVVNAGGPYVARVLTDVIREAAPKRVRLVRGSHIVVPKLYAHDRSYILQNADGRVCFAIPYQQDFTLIGTTDEDFHGDPADVASTAEEERYLCAAVSQYLRRPVDPAAIVWRYSGVRPLLDDGAGKAQEATRDYTLELEAPADSAPLLSVFGGKITTYRRLAEAAIAKLSRFFPAMRVAWTAGAALPGGDFEWNAIETVRHDLCRRYPFLSEATSRRLVRAYGTLAADTLGDARGAGDLGRRFGADLTEREVDWLQRTEWARTADDVLWRRSKLGLRVSPADVTRLADYLAASTASNVDAA